MNDNAKQKVEKFGYDFGQISLWIGLYGLSEMLMEKYKMQGRTKLMYYIFVAIIGGSLLYGFNLKCKSD